MVIGLPPTLTQYKLSLPSTSSISLAKVELVCLICLWVCLYLNWVDWSGALVFSLISWSWRQRRGNGIKLRDLMKWTSSAAEGPPAHNPLRRQSIAGQPTQPQSSRPQQSTNSANFMNSIVFICLICLGCFLGFHGREQWRIIITVIRCWFILGW